MPSAIRQRLNLRAYFALCAENLRRRWWQLLLPIVVIGIFQIFFRLDVNLSESLPDHVFVTMKGQTADIKSGDYIAFKWPGGGPYPQGFHFIKIVLGVPGDVVSMDGERNFYIDKADANKTNLKEVFLAGRSVGKAKTHSLKGEPLQAGLTGVIPPDHFYVYAPHPDSLDSRYAMTGWIPRDAILGKTYPIF